uniref:APEH n=1 Tax=Globodera pallida TaxID=36090 RepID=A0A183CSI6_GLOPA
MHRRQPPNPVQRAGTFSQQQWCT